MTITVKQFIEVVWLSSWFTILLLIIGIIGSGIAVKDVLKFLYLVFLKIKTRIINVDLRKAHHASS